MYACYNSQRFHIPTEGQRSTCILSQWLISCVIVIKIKKLHVLNYYYDKSKQNSQAALKPELLDNNMTKKEQISVNFFSFTLHTMEVSVHLRNNEQ